MFAAAGVPLNARPVPPVEVLPVLIPIVYCGVLLTGAPAVVPDAELAAAPLNEIVPFNAKVPETYIAHPNGFNTQVLPIDKSEYHLSVVSAVLTLIVALPSAPVPQGGIILKVLDVPLVCHVAAVVEVAVNT